MMMASADYHEHSSSKLAKHNYQIVYLYLATQYHISCSDAVGQKVFMSEHILRETTLTHPKYSDIVPRLGAFWPA